MRTNLPVTNVEFPITDEMVVVSKTDTKGIITYFNDLFVTVSGFSAEELMGQPHNIIRHPDMPSEVFENLYATCKAGKPWIAAVKNRCKDGSFYWVQASETAIWENGKITGYMSIRTQLPAEQRAEAERAYALMRAKTAHDYRLDGGILRRRKLIDRLAVFTGTLKARLTTLVAVQVGFMVILGLVGVLAMHAANVRLKSIYEDRAVPLAQLFEINDRMKDNTIALYDAVAFGRAGKPVADTVKRVAGNAEAISKVWTEYLATYLTPEEKGVADSFAPRRKAYVEDGLKPGQALLAAGKYDELDALLAGGAADLFAMAKQDLDRLVAIQVKEAKFEYDSAQHEFGYMIAVVVAVLCLGIGYGGWLGLRTIQATLRPLGRLNGAMEKIAQGNVNSQILIKRDDEIGTALRNVQAMQAKLGFDREEQKVTRDLVTRQRKAEMDKLAHDFEAAVGEIINTVSSASGQLEASAGTLTATASRSQELTSMVANASDQASNNVQSVASATEEMSTSVNEISRQVQNSARIANEAVHQARTTNDRVGELSNAATRIGAVVELINTIAGQTNLLALNATIEAARAGEAGRGFAVVASEVKALAEQTAKATGEIGQQIAGIQTATMESVAAIKEIGDTIGRRSEISSTIAAAVEEQGAATQEIARNVQQAAQGTLQVSSNISDVQRGASETEAASSQVYAAAQSMSKDSERLKAEVGRFIDTVRAA